MSPNAENDARLAAIAALLDEATGYSVPYKRSRFMPIDSAFTNALRDALGVPVARAAVPYYPPPTAPIPPGGE